MRKIISFFNFLARPLQGHLYLFSFAIILLFLTSSIISGTKETIRLALEEPSHHLLNLAVSVIFLYFCFILAKTAERIHPIAGSAIRFITFAAIYILCFFNVYLHIMFGIDVHMDAILLLHETNPREASEFIQSYLFTPNIIKPTVFIVGIPLLLHVLCVGTYRMIGKRITCSYRDTLVGIIVLFSLLSLPTLAPWFYPSQPYPNHYYFIFHSPFRYNPIYLLHNGLLVYNGIKPDAGICAQYCEATPTCPSTFQSKKIVLIIGESYNRHHASMYGYHLPTTEPLDTIQNLCIFSDVISAQNNTAFALRWILSCKEARPDERWQESPTWLTILKKSGYNINYWTTHFPYNADEALHYAHYVFFNKQELSELCLPNAVKKDSFMTRN